MRKIPFKNYIVLLILLLFTVLIVLYLSNLYINRNKETSAIYEYANVITNKDFDVYITENPDTIVYLGNKYDLNYEVYESKFINKIEQLNLKDNLVYINVNNQFINKINREYKVKLNISEMPIMIVFIDGKIVDYVYIDNDSNVDNIINYGVFE